MKLTSVERISSKADRAVSEYFEKGPTHPIILTEATSEWPAARKWTLEYFSSAFHGELGIATLNFRDTKRGKATKLGAYIDHMDKPFASMPGLWFGIDGGQGPGNPDFEEECLWAFNWDALGRYPSLRDDISPYPAFIPNIVAGLSPEISEIFQYLCSVRFFAIYISRKNTVTPLHTDFHHTIGSLAQFESAKTVILFEPNAYALSDAIFDPEHPDFSRFPEMADATAYSAVLQPGEMIIIPPDWWHYTRSHDRSITLSHNFFNNRNFSQFMGAIFEDMDRHPDKQELFVKIRSLLLRGSEPKPPAGRKSGSRRPQLHAM
ncbi:MAG: cupin-like domain-containing protein [Sphingomicrobium sp.]